MAVRTILLRVRQLSFYAHHYRTAISCYTASKAVGVSFLRGYLFALRFPFVITSVVRFPEFTYVNARTCVRCPLKNIKIKHTLRRGRLCAGALIFFYNTGKWSKNVSDRSVKINPTRRSSPSPCLYYVTFYAFLPITDVYTHRPCKNY